MGFFWTIVVLVIALAVAWRYLGAYMVAVYEGRVHFFGFLERPIYRALGTSPEKEQNWKRYGASMIISPGSRCWSPTPCSASRATSGCSTPAPLRGALTSRL